MTPNPLDTADKVDQDECPNTVRLLSELLRGRNDFDRLGWQPYARHHVVNWEHLTTQAPISSTEVAVAHIAHGCWFLERRGGLERLANATVDPVSKSIHPVWP